MFCVDPSVPASPLQRKVLDQRFRIQHDRVRLRDVHQQLQQRQARHHGSGAPADRSGVQIPAAPPQRWQACSSRSVWRQHVMQTS